MMGGILADGKGRISFFKDLSIPEINDEEILIKVKAAGVNRPDLLQAKGQYQPPQNTTSVLGLEVAGVVVKIGKKVRQFQINDHVMALLSGGGYAHFAKAHELLSFKIPSHLSFKEAAALPEGLFTVWHALFQLGKLQRGQKVLIHAAGSGIGTLAISMSNLFGAEVYATAGSSEKCIKILHLNVKKTALYQSAFEEAFPKMNLILDMLGGPITSQNINVLQENGKLVQIAYLLGKKSDINWDDIMHKNLILTGFRLRPKTLEEKIDIGEDIRENAWSKILENQLKPCLVRSFPLEEAQEAHHFLERTRPIGKIVLCVGE